MGKGDGNEMRQTENKPCAAGALQRGTGTHVFLDLLFYNTIS